MVACENKLPSFYFDIKQDLEDNMDSISSSDDTGDSIGMTIETMHMTLLSVK